VIGLVINTGPVEDIMLLNEGQYWPLCLSENVSASKPLGLRLGSTEFAVYRDADNIVRVVEDRCPHRRAPLSRGRITAQGGLQCGYHGWTFRGDSGEICAFPNLDPGERLPNCRIKTYQVEERNGMVYVGVERSAEKSTEKSAEPVGRTVADPAQALALSAKGKKFTGQTLQALSHQQCVIALLDNPQLLIKAFGIEFIDKPIGDPQVDNGMLTANRSARWNLVGETIFYMGPLRHRADFPLRLQTLTAAVTGETLAQIFGADEQLLAEMHIALVPAARGMTTLYWRATVNEAGYGCLSPAVSAMCAMKRSPLTLRTEMDCQKLALTLPGPGSRWQSMSASLAE
jgi:nitrite reductase/ring-hydroxylating ferredoxin subunit